MIYFTLAFVAFLSATLLPMGSEALLLYDVKEGHNVYLLILVASFGNILGSCLNYYLGLKGEVYLEEKKYLKKESILKYKKFFDKYGAYSLLLAWLPIIGDPLTFVAGVLKYDFKVFLAAVSLAKALRYILLVYLVF
ncbi:MAG: DedA family protein [Campylobacteraceae bacterium]|nr:DedA family protein [Campylobacteraceae bacterium]